MSAGLAEAIDELDVACDMTELAHGLALADRLMAKLTDAVGRCDDAGPWALDGSLSMTAWLRHHGRLSSRTASGLAARARKLQRLPVTSDAWASGSLSGDQVQAIVVNLPARTLDASLPGKLTSSPPSLRCPSPIPPTSCGRGPSLTPNPVPAETWTGVCTCPKPSTAAPN